MVLPRSLGVAACLCCVLQLIPCSSLAQQASSGEQDNAEQDNAGQGGTEPTRGALTEFPDLSIPSKADIPSLRKLIRVAKSARPRSPEQYKTMQTAIRDGSRKLTALLKGRETSAEYKQAELDAITASVALMTYFSDKQQAEIVEQLHAFLSSRKPLNLQDVQSGMFAAAMLELQPNKRPARETYELLDSLLEADQRQEMQSLRLNLQASVRRLNLLGNKLELTGVALDGRQVSVSEFEGKFVLVNFFATGDEPCLSEIPRIKKTLEKYRGKGLEVIGISLDNDVQKLKGYLAEAKLPWPIIHDNAASYQDRIQVQLGIFSLPTVLLLNKEGTVVSLEAHRAELDRLMQMLFEAPTPAAPLPESTGNSPNPAPAVPGSVLSGSVLPGSGT